MCVDVVSKNFCEGFDAKRTNLFALVLVLVSKVRMLKFHL